MASFIEIHLQVTELWEKSYYFWIAPRIYVIDMNKVVFEPIVPISLGIGALIDIGTLNQIPMHVAVTCFK